MPVKLQVLKWPHPTLAFRARELVDSDVFKMNLAGLVGDMIETMFAESGMGLAAPQVGQSLRLFVMDKCPHPWVVVNPLVIEQSSRLTSWEEECLSVPNRTVSVRRPKWIVGEWRDLDWNLHQVRLSHMDARCFLHELDHLDGKTIADGAA